MRIAWVSAGAGGDRPPKLEIVTGEVVAQRDPKIRRMSHRAASLWVAECGSEYLVLQCERKLDRHRVLGRCPSSMAAYLLRGQLEALQRLASDKGPDTSMARKAARATGLRR